MRKFIIITILILISVFVYSQNTITGTFPGINNQQIKLIGFNGFDTYVIDSVQANEKGEFKLAYSKTDYGMGYLSAADNKPFFIVLEGKRGKAKALIYLVSKSFYAKLLAVFRVTSNKGGCTPGVDNQVWLNGYDKLNAAQNLKTRGYSPKPLRRVYIQKKNGKKRPLSIPCMYDRAMQALFAIALNPVAELSEAISRPKGVNNRRPKLLWVQGKTQLC